MITNGKLKSLGEVIEDREEQLYIPGEIDHIARIKPEPIEEVSRAPETIYESGKLLPKKVIGIPGDKLARYRTGNWLRVWGKERIARELMIIPPQKQSYAVPVQTSEGELSPQWPKYFVDVNGRELPGFEETPVGLGNIQNLSEGPEVGVWGNLKSALVEAAQVLMAPKEAVYRARIEAARVEEEDAGKAETSGGIIPYLLIGGAVYFLFLRGKGKQQISKRRRD